jgi:hypothetical protein
MCGGGRFVCKAVSLAGSWLQPTEQRRRRLAGSGALATAIDLTRARKVMTSAADRGWLVPAANVIDDRADAVQQACLAQALVSARAIAVVGRPCCRLTRND